MSVHIIQVVTAFVLLRSQSDQPVMVQEDGHRVYHRGYQHVDSEIELVALPQGRILEVLLHNIAVIV